MVTVDVVVVGGGYWGAAISHELRRSGKYVVCIDNRDRMGASRAASGICDIDGYKREIFKKHLPKFMTETVLKDSFAWLIKNGGSLVTEQFWNRFQNRSPREGATCIYVESPQTILRFSKAVTENVIDIEEEQGRIRVKTEKEIYQGTHLVIAAGYQTNLLLSMLDIKHLPIKYLYGRGVVVSGTPDGVTTPISVMVKPYQKHTVRKWGDKWKVGDTAEKTKSETKFKTLLQVGNEVLRNMKVLTISEGIRPMADVMIIEKLSPRILVATGGGRVALGVCGAVASKILEMIK